MQLDIIEENQHYLYIACEEQFCGTQFIISFLKLFHLFLKEQIPISHLIWGAPINTVFTQGILQFIFFSEILMLCCLLLLS